MTALKQYQRLESAGLWRASPDSQRREVLVTFGDATIILKELPSERALTHWSLPAMLRLNPGRMPALFAPGSDSSEELEIDDETMIAAINKVHNLIAQRQPRPGRLRGALLLGVLSFAAAIALAWAPGALIRHTATVLPASTRADIGEAILKDMARLTREPCTSAEGDAALAQLSSRLFSGKPGRIVVLPDGLKTALYLPGDIVAVGRPLIENFDSPDVVAGYILADRERANATNPVADALRYAGIRATISLLTTGNVPTEAFYGYGERLLTAKPAPVADEPLLKQFEVAGVPSTAYAYALDKSGETTLGLIEADPFGQQPPPFPVLNDGDWVALQDICAG